MIKLNLGHGNKLFIDVEEIAFVEYWPAEPAVSKDAAISVIMKSGYVFHRLGVDATGILNTLDDALGTDKWPSTHISL